VYDILPAPAYRHSTSSFNTTTSGTDSSFPATLHQLHGASTSSRSTAAPLLATQDSASSSPRNALPSPWRQQLLPLRSAPSFFCTAPVTPPAQQRQPLLPLRGAWRSVAELGVMRRSLEKCGGAWRSVVESGAVATRSRAWH